MKKDAIFYLYAPNEKWIHMDQPNEITMNKDEWLNLLKDFELEYFEELNDNNLYILKK